MSDVRTHLETIREIDGTGYRRGRERTQALKALAEEVADALLTGRPVPVYNHVEEFFSVNGFAEAVSDAIVAQGKTAVDQRYALAKYVEEKGVEHGREAARILREMNTQSAVLPWEQTPALTDDMFTGCEALGGITALPGSRIELADEVDSQPFEKPTPKTVVVMNRLAEASDCWDLADGDDIRTAFASMPETLRTWTAETVYVSTWAAEVPGLLDQVRARQASFPDARLFVMPIEEIRDLLVRQRVDAALRALDAVDPLDLTDEDTGPEYDTVSQDDIQPGDIVEWHNGDSVERWEVINALSGLVCLRCLTLRSDAFGDIYRTPYLPLPGDPFILRPRS